MSVYYLALKRAFEQLSRVVPTRTPSLNYLRFLSFYLTFSHATFSNQVPQVKNLVTESVTGRGGRTADKGIVGYENARSSSNISF